MGITPAQSAAATQKQQSIGRDPTPEVRVVAGAGTGKSATIEERVRWLLASGTPPMRIAVVSFTRASTRDLAARIKSYGVSHGQPAVLPYYDAPLVGTSCAQGGRRSWTVPDGSARA